MGWVLWFSRNKGVGYGARPAEDVKFAKCSKPHGARRCRIVVQPVRRHIGSKATRPLASLPRDLPEGGDGGGGGRGGGGADEILPGSKAKVTCVAVLARGRASARKGSLVRLLVAVLVWSSTASTMCLAALLLGASECCHVTS